MGDRINLMSSATSAKNFPSYIFGVAAITAIAILALDLSLPLGVAGGVPYVALVLIGIWFPRREHIYYLAGVATVLTVVGYFLSPSGGTFWVVLTNRGLALFVIWVTALLTASRKTYEDNIRSTQNQLEAEVANRTEELRESEARLAAINDTASAGIMVSRLSDGKVVLANAAAREVLDVCTGDDYGKAWADRFADPDDHEDLMIDFSKGEAVNNRELRLKRPDGRDIWVLMAMSEIPEAHEDLLLISFIDITERKQAEAKANENETRFRDYGEAASDWFWEMDKDLRFCFVSDRFERVTGVAPDRLLGRTRQEVGAPDVAPEDWRNHLAQLADHQPFNNFTHSRIKADGSLVWVEISGKPVFDENAVFKGYRGVGRDITEQKAAKEALQESQAQLKLHHDHLQDLVDEASRDLEQQSQMLTEALERERAVNELQRQFVSLVSHEFRTPMTIIDGSAQHIIRQGERVEDKRLAERGQKIRHAIKRLTHLMEGVLFTGRLESGALELDLGPCDISNLLEEVCQDYRSVDTSHIIELDVQQIPTEITADAKVLFQVFSNLLSNAVKYSPDADRVIVSGRNKAGFIEIAVRDFGIGIPEEELSKMCQPYFRASNTTGIAGTGIGLNLVKQLVEAHGGNVYIDSVEGEGSMFTVRLPAGSHDTETGIEERRFSGDRRMGGGDASGNRRVSGDRRENRDDGAEG